MPAPLPDPSLSFRAYAVLSLAAGLSICGCSGLDPAVAPAAIAGANFSGAVHGGQQPVANSHVYLYAVGTGGYGSASASLLGSGVSAVGLTADGSGNSYTSTDANGRFLITANYACPTPTTQVYALASGGNPGLAAGTNNAALTLVAALGSCGNLTPATNIAINELSTAAAITALAQFTVDAAHIGSSSGNSLGIANAFLSVTNIADLTTGGARTVPVSANGSSPQLKLNTLANILSPCVNSIGPASTACGNLFTAATAAGGARPNDIVTAMLSIAKSPGSNVASLFAQIDANAPFGPALSAAPNDYTLPVTFTRGGLVTPGDVVIDASGNAWTANCPSCQGRAGTDSLIGVSPLGAFLSGASGFTANIHMPQGIAFDTLGNLWSVNDATAATSDQIVKMNASGNVAAGFPFSGANLGKPLGIALDSTGSAWISNQTLNSVLTVSATGAIVGSPYTNASFTIPTGIGIDGTGVVFSAGTGTATILKINPNTSTTSILSGAGMNSPLGISIDNADNIWTLNNSNLLSVLNGSTGSAVTPGNGANAHEAAVIAIDGAGTAWLADCRASCPGSGAPAYPDTLLHFNISGTSLTPSQGFEDSHLSAAGTAAIDASGNVWVSNSGGGSLTEFLGIAFPVKTPLANASATNQLGVRP